MSDIFAIENNYIGYAIVNLLDHSFKKQVLITYKTHAHSQLSVTLLPNLPTYIIESLGTDNGDGGKQNHLSVLCTSQRIHY